MMCVLIECPSIKILCAIKHIISSGIPDAITPSCARAPPRIHDFRSGKGRCAEWVVIVPPRQHGHGRFIDKMCHLETATFALASLETQ